MQPHDAGNDEKSAICDGEALISWRPETPSVRSRGGAAVAKLVSSPSQVKAYRCVPWISFIVLAASFDLVRVSPRLAAAEQPKPPNVERLLERLDELYRSKSSIARIEIQVTTPRSTRSLRLRAWTRGETEALIVSSLSHVDRERPLVCSAQRIRALWTWTDRTDVGE